MKWHIRSSSGRNYVSVEFRDRRHDEDGNTLVVASVEIHGLFWPRLGEEFEGDVVEDFSVVLHQVVFRREKLDDFLRQIDAWCRQPFPISLDLALGPRNDQSLRISIQEDKGFVSTAARPVCAIEYCSGTFQSGRWSFVVDRSCIGVLADELSDALAAEKHAENGPDSH